MKSLLKAMRPAFYMFKVCMYCGKLMDLIDCAADQHELTSHGTCPECAKIPYPDRYKKAIERKRRNNVLS